MRIGIDARLWNQTGVGRYIRNLVKNLQEIDFKNEYVLFVKKEDFDAIHNSEFIIQNSKWKIVETDIKWHSLKEQIELPKLLNKENLDLVHFPYFSMPLLYKKPFVVTIHDLIVHHFPTGRASTLPFPLYKIKRKGYERVIDHAVKKSEKIIVPLYAVKEDLIRTLNVPAEKIIVTYEGVDKKISNIKYQISNITRNKYGKYFLYVGNAYPHKNLERLIAAFTKFIEKTGTENVKLLLVGKDDFFYKRLEKKVKEQDLDSVIFLHNVTDKDLSKFYKNAIALVIPSLMEGFGLPAVEAMSNNCLVIASNIKSLNEVCSNTAIYFDPLNPQDLAKKMTEVFQNGKNHYKNNFRETKKRLTLFSWKKMSEETLQVYESCFSIR